ncbi:MAG TPA: Rrf2 family transcriptional regulator [Coriobacteriia bacterium]|nr:Rrf2 family transcriptional regulator [Coriobacteriia bacterium]
MKVSTKARYALRFLLDLAEHRDEGFIPLKDVAARQNISKQYLEQIVALLHSANVLRSNRGKQGGYLLAKDPDRFTVGQILRITEGSLAPIACLDEDINVCERVEHCKTLPMWTGLDKVITEYLDGITLQDMLDQYQERGADSYVI